MLTQEPSELVDIVKQYISLQESRKVLKGNCPFHDDSMLSFMVMPAKNTFKCFGCGLEGGTTEFLTYVVQQMPGKKSA
jgi:DNA primase